MLSQQSNSVPSTPAQHPRDIRFPSRSPSPTRGLGYHSPRSVVSEAPGRPQTQNVCKFEAGAEFRKRRIPYKDGGNDPLPPPKTEPKKALEPDEEDKLSGDMRELYDRLLPSKESEERRAKLVSKLEHILEKTWPGNDIKVNVFGSSGNLLSSTDSDVDICVTTTLKALESMHSLATVLNEHGMDMVVCRATARVPIVKFWDPELQLACDMNVNNPLALENTRMIKTYVQIDDRVRPLAKIIKHWTKVRILNDAAFGGTISSYTWICMIMNFLQSRQPPILPSLQKLPDSRRSTINGKISPFADDLDSIKGYGKDNHESLGELLFRFFRFYGYEIDYAESVVSVKEGRVVPRKEKGWDATNYHDKEARSRLCVEEPFNNARNLGNSADDYAFSGIHQEIRRAFDLIAQGKLDECCEQYEFPPEEKPLFQRPPPKPKPTLTRSASQSGRSHAGSVGAKTGNREGRSNRNNSNHRNSNRRASSGAAYGNLRYNFASPPVGVAGPDYFGATTAYSTDQLHEQLYRQYQFLQAQQEALRSQLLQQQAQTQAQAQVQAQSATPQLQGSVRNGEYGTPSPRQRQFNSLPSPRPLNNSPNTAPLLPGYLYHYPARYPVPASPLAQARSHEGNGTSPSSLSTTTSVPSLRRTLQRASAPDQVSIPSARSQSQPGRSFPSPLALHGLAHPGYDVSGAIGSPFMTQNPVQVYQQHTTQDLLNGIQANSTRNGIAGDVPFPKEYVGYYVGQSPQLGPQYPISNPSAAPLLQDIPIHNRRLSPERLPPILPNGMRRQSRSPSPLSRGESSPASSASRSNPIPQLPFPNAIQEPRSTDSGPVIVNGSNPLVSQPVIAHSHPIAKAQEDEAVHGLGLEAGEQTTLPRSEPLEDLTSATATSNQTLQSESMTGSAVDKPANGLNPGGDVTPPSALRVSPRMSPNGRAQVPARLNPSPSESHQSDAPSTHIDRITDVAPTIAHPILSPVAELRTPSPTSSKDHISPKVESHIKTVQAANAKLNEKTNSFVANGATKPEPSQSKPTISETGDSPNHIASGFNSQAGQWQQATRKGHKKGKSAGNVKAPSSGGEPMPANELERKGG
ncbi:hypothetical protein MBLNU457_6339t1 [Dothideomycetes sp. NU457]